MALDTAAVLAWVDDWTRRQFGGSINDTFSGHSAADWVVLGEYAPAARRAQVDAPLREVALAAGLSESFDWWPYLAEVARGHWQRYGQPFRWLESPVGYLVEGAAGLAAQDYAQLAPVVERIGASGYLESTQAQQVARRDEHKAVNRAINTTIAVALAGGWLAAGAGAGAGAGAAEGAGAAAGTAGAAEGGGLLYLDALEEGLAAYDFAATGAAVAESAPWWQSWADTGQELAGKWAASRIAQSLAPDRPAVRDVAASAGVPLAPGAWPVGGASGDGALFSSAATRQLVILGGLGLLAIVAIGVLKK